MNAPLAISSNEGGPDHLKSWCWSHVDHLIGQHHRGGFPYPLTPQARRQEILKGNQRYPSTLDGERSVGWEQPWRRSERLHWDHPSAWAIRLHLWHLLCLPAQTRKKGNLTSIYNTQEVEAPTTRTQGSETNVRRVQYFQHRPEEPSRLSLRQPISLRAEKCVHRNAKKTMMEFIQNL